MALSQINQFGVAGIEVIVIALRLLVTSVDLDLNRNRKLGMLEHDIDSPSVVNQVFRHDAGSFQIFQLCTVHLQTYFQEGLQKGRIQLVLSRLVPLLGPANPPENGTLAPRPVPFSAP